MKRILLVVTFIIAISGYALAQAPQLSVQSITPDVIITNEETELIVTLINKGDVATESNTVVTLSSNL